MRKNKGYNENIGYAIENEEEYIYNLKLNCSKSMDRKLLKTIHSVMNEKNLTVRDAFLYVFEYAIETLENKDNIINDFTNKVIDNEIVREDKEVENEKQVETKTSINSLIPPELYNEFVEENISKDKSEAVSNLLKKNFGTNY